MQSRQSFCPEENDHDQTKKLQYRCITIIHDNMPFRRQYVFTANCLFWLQVWRILEFLNDDLYRVIG